MAVAHGSHCRSKIVLFLCLQPDFLWHMDIEPVFMSPITLLQCLHNNLLEIPCNLSLLWGPGLWSSLLPDTVGWGDAVKSSVWGSRSMARGWESMLGWKQNLDGWLSLPSCSPLSAPKAKNFITPDFSRLHDVSFRMLCLCFHRDMAQNSRHCHSARLPHLVSCQQKCMYGLWLWLVWLHQHGMVQKLLATLPT